MSVVYLKFATTEDAVAALTAAGFQLSEWGDHFSSGAAWGTIFSIPDVEGTHANLYDGDCPAELEPYRIDAPPTPYNVVA